ncbi:MAG: D-amino acid dehydrogenase small subunit [candidate division WS6 bacterium OLB20]|uniref:D-amino acid dehydrogenase small subunit n=1 Tax=candidate division WS6 bacterium OLB20 TaxID=1617426 RepID=A0A136M0P5_9BACT|nr:MAG: D-amino acid dehydrogenase small subunit [candidate division WS6 bacterium OLB20]
MNTSVAVLGGGVGGLSVAHELVKSGFSVTVYDKNSIWGGKARSMPVPASGTDGRADLPGEHGYRFFPGFYRHIDETMAEIPYKAGSVLDNLVHTKVNLMTRTVGGEQVVVSRFPRSLRELENFLDFMILDSFDVPQADAQFFSQRIWQLMTSCKERRDTEYEQRSAWEMLDAENRSENYRTMFIEQVRALVAADPRKISAKTAGNIFLKLMSDIINPGSHGNDRLLNGPTNDVWIDPWVDYLTDKGVTFISGVTVQSLETDSGRITGVVAHDNETSRDLIINADYYVLAVPVERAAEIIRSSAGLLDTAQSLRGIGKLADEVEWMNGLQLYLNKDIDHYSGHVMIMDSPWSLTFISQLPFWKDFDISRYGDGSIKTLLSVDISDWHRDGLFVNKPAEHCTPEEIKDEVWGQLKATIGAHGIELHDNDLVTWFLDPAVSADTAVQSHTHNTNAEPLLINTAGSWKLRPEAGTEITNLMLAADYIRTDTDLATMEAANEAARRAANAICRGEQLPEHSVIHEWKDPAWLHVFHIYDRSRFRRGLAWKGYNPVRIKLAGMLRSLLRRLWR